MRSIFLIVTIISSINFVFGQKADYQKTIFTKKNGLGQDYVYSILQDQRGFLWIGTGDGLSKYDGKSMVNFTTEDSLSNNFITTTTLDKHGNLILGHFTPELTVFNGMSYSSLKEEELNSKIVKLTTSKTGSVWGITQRGKLFKVENGIIKFLDRSVTKDKIINDMIVYEDNLLVATNEGLIVFRVNDTEVDQGQLHDALAYINVTALRIAQNKGFWLGTEDAGIYKGWGNENIKIQKRFNDDFDNSGIKVIMEDRQNTLWIGTRRNGIINVNLNLSGENIVYDKFNNDNGYPNSITEIIEDTEGNIWIGTIGNGLLQIVKNRFSVFSLKEKLGVDVVYSCIRTVFGEYWFATDKGVIKGFYETIGSEISFEKNVNKELEGYDIRFLYNDNDGSIWFGTNSGEMLNVDMLRSEIRHKISSDLPADGQIRCVSIDKSGNYWLSISGNGVYNFDKDLNLKGVLNTETGFIHNDIFAIQADNNNNIWFGAKAAGLTVLRADGSFDYLTQKELFPSRDINDITIDYDGNIWIATDGDGIFKYNGKEFINFTKKDGLLSPYCRRLVTDDNNAIWITHRNGISKLETTNNKIFSFSQEYGIVELDSESGILFNDGIGGVWFSGPDELFKYNVNLDRNIKTDLSTHITDIRFYYDRENLMKYSDDFEQGNLIPASLTLPHNKNHITFDFVAVSLQSQRNIFYKHQLKGYENKWSPPTTDNVVTYTNLSPGKYSLMIMASDNKQIWVGDPTVYEFVIEDPFWEKWWFYILQMVFLCALFIITYHLSKYSSNRKKDIFILRLMVYVCLFIIFEYLQNFLEPFTENFIGGAPIFKILINLLLALMLFPVEGLIKTFFYKESSS